MTYDGDKARFIFVIGKPYPPLSPSHYLRAVI